MSLIQKVAKMFNSPSELPEDQRVKKLSLEKRKALADEFTPKINAGISKAKPAKEEMYEADKWWLGEHWDADNDPPWMPKPVENWVFATIEQHSANLNTGNPKPIITGQDPGDDDVAFIYKKVVDALSQPTKLNLPRLYRRAVHTAMKAGTALAKITFDPTVNGGRNYDPPIDFTDALTGKTEPLAHTLYKGEVAVELVDPANVIPDPNGYELDGPATCEWIAIRTYRTRSWVETTPMFTEYLGKSRLKQVLDEYGGNKGKSDVEFYHGRAINTSPSGTDMYVIDEVWRRRRDEFGRWHIDLFYKMADEILYYAEDVYDDGHYPFAILHNYEISKSFFGMPEAKQVIPNNKVINMVNRLIIHNAMLIVERQKLIGHDAGIDAKEFTDKAGVPGAAFNVRDPSAVKELDGGDISPSLFKAAEHSKEGIRTIMAMDEANMGQFGGSVTAASGIKMIQDKANVRDTVKGYNIEDFVARVVYLIISRIKQFYTEDRYIPIIGEGSPQRFFKFNSLKHQDINLVVKTEAGSGSPMSKSSIEQRAMELFDKQAQGNFDPPLITAQELMDSFDGFPMSEAIKDRIRRQEEGLQAQQTVQIAQTLIMLAQQGLPVFQMTPEQLVPIIQQLEAQQAQQPQQAPGQPPAPQPQ